MTVQRIYRLETRERTGVFQSGAIYRLHSRHQRAVDHMCQNPGPHRDEGLADWWERLHWESQGDYFFAFDSLAQLRQWFPARAWKSFARALDAQGVVVREFDVPKHQLRFGYAQVVTRRENLLAPVRARGVRRFLKEELGE